MRREWYGWVWKKLNVSAAVTAVVKPAPRPVSAASATTRASAIPTFDAPTSSRIDDVAAPMTNATIGPMTIGAATRRVCVPATDGELLTPQFYAVGGAQSAHFTASSHPIHGRTPIPSRVLPAGSTGERYKNRGQGCWELTETTSPVM